jgi:hypothetical protein
MFENCLMEDLKSAAFHIAATITLSFCMDFRSYKEAVIPAMSNNVRVIFDEALNKAMALEEEAENKGMVYKLHFCRIYHPNVSDFYHDRITRGELALHLILVKIAGQEPMEPVQVLS